MKIEITMEQVREIGRKETAKRKDRTSEGRRAAWKRHKTVKCVNCCREGLDEYISCSENDIHFRRKGACFIKMMLWSINCVLPATNTVVFLLITNEAR